MSIVSEMTTVARRKIGKTYLGLWFAILMMVALIAIMWICNITGSPGWALLIGSFGMIALAFITFAPKTVFVFLGFGALVAELKDEDISQGTLKGVNALYRVFLALGYAFMGMSGLLGTWSFANYPAAFWVIAFFGTFLLILLAHNKVTMGKWMLFLAGGYAIAVILWMIGLTMYPVQQGSNTLNDTIVAGASSIGINPTPAAAAPVVRTPPVATDPVCKDYNTGYVLGGVECTVVTLTKVVQEFNAPDGFCVWANSANSQKEIATQPDDGNIRKFYSKTGQPVQAGIFLVKEGSVALGTMCG